MTSIHKKMQLSRGSIAAAFSVSLVFLLAVEASGQPKRGIDGLEGLYRYRFDNGLMDGTKYKSENRLTILKVTASSAYFNTHLEWANGHSCDLSGVADVDSSGALVYREPSLEGRVCVFTIKQDADRLVFDDKEGSCRLISCGTRGMLSGVEFQFSSRAKVRADEIRKSPDFARALEEYKHRSR